MTFGWWNFSPINFKLDLAAEISYVIIEWPSLYMKHIGHHHSFPTMINDCVQHSSMCPTITNLDLYSFGDFCARLLIIKLFHLKAKMKHDFRWEKLNEAEARPFQNITTDFDHSLAYQNNEAFYMVLQSSILANLVTYFKVQIWQT